MSRRQPDLFGELEAEEDYERRCAVALAGGKLDCCTGEPPAPGWVDDNRGDGSGHHYPRQRCGRCGELDSTGSIMVNHDLGWCGCPKDRAAMLADGGSGWCPRHLTPEEMRARHDRHHHPDCLCGDPWGLHSGRLLAEENACATYCGCEGYRHG